MQKDKETLEESIEDLQQNINQLEKQVEEAKEHERLIIEYPDLNGPVNPDLTGWWCTLVDTVWILKLGTQHAFIETQ